MPAGLQVRDQASNLILDTSTFTGRTIGIQTVASGSGSFVVSQKVTGESIFAVLVVANNGANCSLTINNSTSTVSYTIGSTTGYIVYGVY